MSLSKAQIEEHFASPVWKAIEEKMDGLLREADILIEQPDPYLHGKAIGRREMLRVFQGIEKILLTECSGTGPYTK